MKNKLILDACCGGKTFWFNKNHPNTIYIDTRKKSYTLCDGRKFTVKPDQVMDFRNLKFKNNTFSLVVFDPPHLIDSGNKSWLTKKYGSLNKNTWESDLRRGFNECWRVLKKNGVLIFKWNEDEIPVKKIINIVSHEPLFGHRSGRNSKTHWLCFMKI